MAAAACALGTVWLLSACPGAAAAPCPAAQREELVGLGYGPPDLNRLCGNAPALFERGSKARDAGDLRTAQSLFEMGLAVDPGSVPGQKLLDETKAALSSAQQLFAQAYSAKEAGDLETAERLFEQGLAVDSGNTLGQKFLAEVRAARGNARKLFEQGFDAKQAGDLQAAERLFEMGLKIEPTNAAAQNFLLETKALSGRPAAAENPAAAIQQMLESRYRLSQPNADETGIDAVGATVALQKSRLVMNRVTGTAKNRFAAANVYEDGTIKPQGLGGALNAVGALFKAARINVAPSRYFNRGDTFLVTRIAVRDGEIVFNLMSSVIDNERFSGTLKFRFANRDAAAPDQAAALVAEVLKVQ